MDPNNTPDPAVVSEQPETNATAAFLFGDEPEVQADLPVAETPVAASGSPEDLAKLAADAQRQVDPPTVITPEQEAQILAQQTQQKSAETLLDRSLAQQPSVPIIAPVVPQAPVQPVQQAVAPTQEEIQRQLNIFNLDEKGYDAIFDTDDKAESIKALNTVLQAAVRQAVTMSHVLIQEQAAQLQQKVQPYMQFADDQRHSVLQNEFYSRHKDLQSAQPVVDAVLKQFQDQGVKFDSHEKLFDAVAQNTKAYLLQMQQLGQTVAPAAHGLAQAQAAPATGKPRMAALPSGGQGGAGAGGGKSGNVSTAQALFG